MKDFSLFNSINFEKWMREVEMSIEKMSYGVPLNRESLLEEIEVCALLGVSQRTVRTYRKRKYLRYIKLNGRIFYLKLFLFLDFMKMSLESGR